MSDLISRQAAIEHLKKRLYETALNNNTEYPYYEEMADNRVSVWLEEVPSAPHVMTYKEVAEIIAGLFGDECACNYNGNDEWLPQSCKYAETECPSPKEKNGCWMQFLIQGGADMRGEQDG